MRSMSNIGLATGLTDGMSGHKLCYGPLKQVYLCKGAVNERKAGGELYSSLRVNVECENLSIIPTKIFLVNRDSHDFANAYIASVLCIVAPKIVSKVQSCHGMESYLPPLILSKPVS